MQISKIDFVVYAACSTALSTTTLLALLKLGGAINWDWTTVVLPVAAPVALAALAVCVTVSALWLYSKIG